MYTLLVRNRKASSGDKVPIVYALSPETVRLPARSHTFVKIDHEINFIAILLNSADSRRVVVSYKRKYVHEVLTG